MKTKTAPIVWTTLRRVAADSHLVQDDFEAFTAEVIRKELEEAANPCPPLEKLLLPLIRQRLESLESMRRIQDLARVEIVSVIQTVDDEAHQQKKPVAEIEAGLLNPHDVLYKAVREAFGTVASEVADATLAEVGDAIYRIRRKYQHDDHD